MLENLFRTHVMRFFFCCYCYCCCWYFLLLLMCFANGDLIHFSFKWFPVRDTCSPRQHQTTTAAAQQQTKCLENDEKWKATDRTTWIWPFWAFIKSKRLLIIGSIGMVSRLATVKKNRLNNIDFFFEVFIAFDSSKSMRCFEGNQINCNYCTETIRPNFVFLYFSGFFVFNLSCSPLFVSFTFKIRPQFTFMHRSCRIFNTFVANQSIVKIEYTVFRLCFKID